MIEPGRSVVRVITDDGVRLAEPAGRLYADWPPAVGDWTLTAPMNDDRVMVQRVLTRKTTINRKGSGLAVQPMAANIDIGLIVLPLSKPVRLNLVERAVALIMAGGATPAIALTKTDLCDNPGKELAKVQAVAQAVTVIPLSSVTKDGINKISEIFALSATVALLGPSGAGKSTLVNMLAGDTVMATAEVRESDNKGRHTTTTRRLIKLPNGSLVADIPGFRELGLSGSEADHLNDAFTEIGALAKECRFIDCCHDNEPGCALLTAVESGALEKRRFESYMKLYREATSNALRANEAEKRASEKRFGKMVKEAKRIKKHR